MIQQYYGPWQINKIRQRNLSNAETSANTYGVIQMA